MQNKFHPLNNSRELEVREIQSHQEAESRLEIRHIWMPFNPPVVFGCVMGLVIFMTLLMGGIPRSQESLTVFCLFITCIGYVVAAHIFNSTYISVTRTGLKWKHRPLPWRRGGRVVTSQIDAITFGKVDVIRPYTESTRSNWLRSSRSRPRVYYAISVRQHDGCEWRVLDGLQSQSTALAAANAMARVLGVPDEIRVESSPQQNTSLLHHWAVSWIIIGLVLAVVVYGILTANEYNSRNPL